MSCNTSNCTFTINTNCVIYGGETIASLGVCKGDSLTELLAAITDNLVASVDGSSIILSDITYPCDLITNAQAGKTKSVFNLVQTLLTTVCTLNTEIEDLSTIVNAPFTYDYKDIVTPTADSTQGTIQGVINELSTIATTVDTITDELGSGSIIDTVEATVGNALIDQVSGYGVTKSGSGASASLTFFGAVPPFCPVFCVAPLSNFNADGSGKTGTGFAGWYVCNGNNGTPDMRGYTAAGATNLPGINSPSLLPAVDSTVSGDPTYAASVLERKGEVKHGLTVSELPSHSISGTTDPHTHTVPGIASIAAGESFQSYNVFVDTGSTETSSEAVGFTSDSIGSNVRHENRQPTLYGYFIMRLS